MRALASYFFTDSRKLDISGTLGIPIGMSKDNEDNKIVSLDAFRKKNEAPEPEQSAPAAEPAGSPEDVVPPYDTFYEFLSTPALTPQNMRVAMRNLLNSLNAHYALQKQNTDLPEGAGLFVTHLPLTHFDFADDAMNEIGTDFAEQLKAQSPAKHYRTKTRNEQDRKDWHKRKPAPVLAPDFRTAAVGRTPAYKDLAGQLKEVFPDATFTPSLLQNGAKGMRPCLCIQLPQLRDRDLRAHIKDYLDNGNDGPKPDGRHLTLV